MCKVNNRVARIVLSLAISGLLFSVSGADPKPDKKKSQAACLLGERADRSGRRDEAIAAYTEALEADNGNAVAWRARAKDYLSDGDMERAAADLDTAVKVQPGDPQCYM